MGHDLGPILVTGASGFLGRQVLARITAREWSCVATSASGSVGEPCDLTDVVTARRLLNRTAPAVVIHCAAVVPKSTAAYADTAAADASVAMLKTLADNAVCPIVLASSMTVYGPAPDCPVDEGSAHLPAPGYARGKWMAEQLLFDRQRAGDVALRLPGLFGLPRRSGLLYNAAKAFLTAGLPGSEDPGLQTRFELAPSPDPWAAMSVVDAAEYLVSAAANRPGHAPQAVNVGYEGEFTVVSAVAQIASACGVGWRPPLSTAKPFSMRLERLASRYGMPSVTFDQRLNEFVDAVRHDLALEPALRR